jgi:pyridoxine 4-dehydrogenase
MTDLSTAGTFTLGDRAVNRLGYGAMQLAGPGVFGPPQDRDAALAVLRERRQPHRHQRLLRPACH